MGEKPHNHRSFFKKIRINELSPMNRENSGVFEKNNSSILLRNTADLFPVRQWFGT